MSYVGGYLIAGNTETLEALLDRLERERVIARGNPDLFARSYRAFGIDDAHDIRSRAQTRPVAGAQRVFAFFAPSLTTEAQNALLKTIEEPSAQALFFIVTPSPETVLPTIRSRTQMLEIEGPFMHRKSSISAADFLKATAEKRIEMLKPLYEHDEEGRDMGPVISFLQSLEATFARERLTVETKAGLHAIYRARKYATDKGSLLKALLEQVALLAPKM